MRGPCRQAAGPLPLPGRSICCMHLGIWAMHLSVAVTTQGGTVVRCKVAGNTVRWQARRQVAGRKVSTRLNTSPPTRLAPPSPATPPTPSGPHLVVGPGQHEALVKKALRHLRLGGDPARIQQDVSKGLGEPHGESHMELEAGMPARQPARQAYWSAYDAPVCSRPWS